MIMNDRLRDLVLQKSSSHVIREAAIECGMKTMKDDAIAKILLGLTTLEECLRVIYAG
jgi:type II secretory ATPase GspE/PulE/Tfp pilus assembly ATPase PilB-like protein